MKPSIAPYPISRAIAIIPSLPNPSCDETLYCPIPSQPCDCDNPIVAQSIVRWNPLLPHTLSVVRLRWSRRCAVHLAMKPSIALYPVSRAMAIIPSLPSPSCDETLFCPIPSQPCDCDNPIVTQSVHLAMKPSFAPYPVSRAMAMIVWVFVVSSFIRCSWLCHRRRLQAIVRVPTINKYQNNLNSLCWVSPDRRICRNL